MMRFCPTSLPPLSTDWRCALWRVPWARWLLLSGLGVGLGLLLAGCASQRPVTDGAVQWSVPASQRPLLPQQQREALLAQALLLLNTPYTYGGNTPQGGFDCSGLVQYAVASLYPQPPPALPRSTAQWAQASQPIARQALQRGDLVFFNTNGQPYSHMGIYAGNGQFVHAPSSGGTVQKAALGNPYFAKRFTQARRVFR